MRTKWFIVPVVVVCMALVAFMYGCEDDDDDDDDTPDTTTINVTTPTSAATTPTTTLPPAPPSGCGTGSGRLPPVYW